MAVVVHGVHAIAQRLQIKLLALAVIFGQVFLGFFKGVDLLVKVYANGDQLVVEEQVGNVALPFANGGILILHLGKGHGAAGALGIHLILGIALGFGHFILGHAELHAVADGEGILLGHGGHREDEAQDGQYNKQLLHEILLLFLVRWKTIFPISDMILYKKTHVKYFCDETDQKRMTLPSRYRR